MKEKDYSYIPLATILNIKIKDVVESKPSGLLKVICNIKDKTVWAPPAIAGYLSQYLGKDMEYACVIHLTGIFIVDILDSKQNTINPTKSTS